MTPQEQQLLDDFLTRLAGVPQIRKDRAAAAAIDAAFARQPNAAYLVVQRALLLQQALDDAQAELARIKAAGVAMPARDEPSTFLDPHAWGRREPAAGPAVAANVPAGRVPVPSGGMGGFLGQSAAIAAGVAGGAFLFHGLQHLRNRPDAAAVSGADFPDQSTGLETGAADAPPWDAAVGGIDGDDLLA